MELAGGGASHWLARPLEQRTGLGGCYIKCMVYPRASHLTQSSADIDHVEQRSRPHPRSLQGPQQALSHHYASCT
jgi:hypothetical protein